MHAHPYREADRPVFSETDKDNELERLDGERVVLIQRTKKWDDFFHRAIDTLTQSETDPVSIAERAEKIADAAYDRWLPRDVERHATGCKIVDDMNNARLPIGHPLKRSVLRRPTKVSR
jgi:hypothetical protein